VPAGAYYMALVAIGWYSSGVGYLVSGRAQLCLWLLLMLSSAVVLLKRKSLGMRIRSAQQLWELLSSSVLRVATVSVVCHSRKLRSHQLFLQVSMAGSPCNSLIAGLAAAMILRAVAAPLNAPVHPMSQLAIVLCCFCRCPWRVAPQQPHRGAGGCHMVLGASPLRRRCATPKGYHGKLNMSCCTLAGVYGGVAPHLSHCGPGCRRDSGRQDCVT
jgi:hypothetical protein